MSTRKKKTHYTDPKADREASNYDKPVPSREAVLACLAEQPTPLSFERLMKYLGVTSEDDQVAMARRLRAMERDGQILRNRRGRYGTIDKMNLVRGTITGHADGYGFLVPDDGGEDLFLSAREMRKALHGDRVTGYVSGVDKRGRAEGVLVDVLERRHQHVVGRYFNENRVGIVVPEDKRISQDILIPLGDEFNARDGQMVVTAITQQPGARHQPVGRITEILGDHMAPGMEVDVAIRKYELPHVFPDAVLAEAARFGDSVPGDAIASRKDIRTLPLVTIDGVDARDFDDAVYCEPLQGGKGKGWRLIVAIADVSFYVAPGSRLDKEAYERGTSVYFPNRVIPMLPEALSNGLCSLNPGVDRLCMVCDMEISPSGRIQHYSFYQATMRSHARLTYDEVAAILVHKNEQLQSKRSDILPQLQHLYTLYKTLLRVRLSRGAVDFELPETYIEFDSNKKISCIVPRERNDAHRLIEECMLSANVCAADILDKHKVPAPYRIHAGPTDEKLTALREFLFELGLSLSGGDKPQAQDYADVLEQAKERPEYRLVQTVLLRSLSQAIYSPDNIGHFALAYPHYAHFTSPIRRYPDLMVHRIIKNIVTGKKQAKTGSGKERKVLEKEQHSRAQAQSEHCSMVSRRADEASWDVIKWLKTEYMMDKLGQEYEGIISGVTNFGIFVELKEVFVEGLVHITSLGNDYYRFDPTHHRLTGERTRTTFRLGDSVKVSVSRVDLDEARIDFELLELKSSQLPKDRKTDKKSRKKKSKKTKGRRQSKRKKRR
ncbi:MAG: ribonuclease R [Gammaproteobacteria bacterium]|nr:MAG: ribonuclease R [Gammaproteobacteria bacterium]